MKTTALLALLSLSSCVVYTNGSTRAVIAATDADTVTVNAEGMTINGLNHSTPIATIGAGTVDTLRVKGRYQLGTQALGTLGDVGGSAVDLLE